VQNDPAESGRRENCPPTPPEMRLHTRRLFMNGSRIRGRGNWRRGFLGQPIRAERAKLKSCRDDDILAHASVGPHY
jgi:hypothetical protein